MSIPPTLNHGEPIYANLIRVPDHRDPNQCWVADLTFVRLPESFVYLACLLDAYYRKCIGWSLARRIDSSLPLQALEMALAGRKAGSWIDSPFGPRAVVLQFRLR